MAKEQRKNLLQESKKAAEQVIQEALRQLEEPEVTSNCGAAGAAAVLCTVPNPRSPMPVHGSFEPG